MMGFDYQRPAAGSDDAPAFGQDYLHQRWFLIQLLGQFASARRRAHGGEIDHLPFGFGDDFMRDHDDIVV